MGPSRTAAYVALFRAIENARPADRRLFSDPYAAGFLDPGLILVAGLSGIPGFRSLVPRAIDRRYPASRLPVIVRTPMIDEAVAAGLEGGASQMVILGAGYDMRSLRLPAAERARVFELDQPATQEKKTARLEKMNGALPPHVTYVPFDLEEEGVGRPLDRAGFASGRTTVVVWEGVVSYLTPEAVDSTVNWVARECGPGSRLVFTYVDISMFGEGGSAGDSVPWGDDVAKAGEPFRFGFDPAEIGSYMSERGLDLDWDRSTAEGRGGENAPDFYRVAQASVSAR